MLLEILAKAEGIEGFKFLEELEVAMISYSPIQYQHTDAMVGGFDYLLDIIEQDTNVQKETLHETMLHVKRNLGLFTSFNYTLKQINSLTVAISHVNLLLDIAEISEKAEEYYVES